MGLGLGRDPPTTGKDTLAGEPAAVGQAPEPWSGQQRGQESPKATRPTIGQDFGAVMAAGPQWVHLKAHPWPWCVVVFTIPVSSMPVLLLYPYLRCLPLLRGPVPCHLLQEAFPDVPLPPTHACTHRASTCSPISSPPCPAGKLCRDRGCSGLGTVGPTGPSPGEVSRDLVDLVFPLQALGIGLSAGAQGMEPRVSGSHTGPPPHGWRGLWAGEPV